MKDSKDGIPGKNQLIKMFRNDYLALMFSLMAKFQIPEYDRKDKIQGFFVEKLCDRSPGKLMAIYKKGPAYFKVMFKNYLTDEIRKQNRLKKKENEVIDHISSLAGVYVPAYGENQYLIKKCERIIYKAFSAHLHRQVFHLWLEGADTKEIVQETKLSEGNVRTIICRIRKELKDKF